MTISTTAYKQYGLARVTGLTTNFAGALTDPTALTFQYRVDGGTVTLLTYGVDAGLVKSTTGTYYVDVSLTLGGVYHYEWKATGAIIADDHGYLVVEAPADGMTVDDRKVDGIDVSHYQQGEEGYRPEWAKVLTDNRIRFIAVKATQGLTAVDSEFKANIAELRTLVPHPNGSPGSPWLAWYHFRTNEDTVGQCSHFRQVVGPLRDGEGIVLDCEGNTSGTYADQRAICAVAGKMFDRVSIRYGGDTAWTFDDFVKWTARYRAQKPTYPCSCWQFGSANVPGITGGVDANRILDEAGLAKAFHAVSVPTPPTEDDMTDEQAKQLAELHTAMMAGWPAYGTQPVAKEVSRIGRMVRNLAVKAGIQVEPAD